MRDESTFGFGTMHFESWPGLFLAVRHEENDESFSFCFPVYKVGTTPVVPPPEWSVVSLTPRTW